MTESRGNTFWATIDRISNQGNGVIEKDGGGHYIVGPVKKEAVEKTVEVRMVGRNEAELVNLDLRKDVFAEEENTENETLSTGDIVSGRITKQSPDGTPVVEKQGTRIKVPGAELNETVEVKIQTISKSNAQWIVAKGTKIDSEDSSEEHLLGSVVSDVELYEELPNQNVEEVVCPVADCGYTGQPQSVAGHVSGKRDSDHNWQNLGYGGANAYKDNVVTDTEISDSSSTLFHISDAHLGASLNSTSNYSRESRCLKGFRRALDVAIDREADAILNTGDLFHNDTIHGIPETVKTEARNQLQRLSNQNIPFYSIDGDHEREKGRKTLATFEREGLVTSLDENPTEVGEGIVLYGRNFAKAEDWDETNWSLNPHPDNWYGIVALHQSIKPISNSDYPECTARDVSQRIHPCAHAVAAGHLHRTGISWQHDLPFVLGGTTESKRAQQASTSPIAGQFIQDGQSLRYQRIRLPA